MPQKNCPQCDGTGWKAVQVDGVRRMTPCDCQSMERSTSLLKQARIPPRYEHCELANFDVRKNTATGLENPSLTMAKICAQRFVDEYPTDFGLLFVGPTGVGKTHLGVAILRELMLRKGVECQFFDFQPLLKSIRRSYDPGTQTTEFEVLQPVLDVEVLLLDELASANPSDWERETAHHIINWRYNYKKITLITTTMLAKEPPREFGKRVEPSRNQIPDLDYTLDRLGITLRSRLYEMCKLVEMQSDDYRKAIKQAGHKYHLE